MITAEEAFTGEQGTLQSPDIDRRTQSANFDPQPYVHASLRKLLAMGWRPQWLDMRGSPVTAGGVAAGNPRARRHLAFGMA